MTEGTDDVYVPEFIDVAEVRGFLHASSGPSAGSLALTHGAGGNVDSPLLVASADAWSARGFTVLRFDLAFRRRKPSGPPHPSKADADRASVEAAVTYLGRRGGPILLGGHSYGGRQASMLVAEKPELVDGLILMSYPLHPPGKPEKARTAHLPQLRTRTMFVHGTKDPFGSPAELSDAIASVPAHTATIEISGAGHDLSAEKYGVADLVVEKAFEFFDAGSWS
ncbi:alpha/beta fold hydrolase [Rhodococcus sp. PAMC28707]|uniref:alpha/beta hydrolase family protein n=1 Tax=unclassified Rhodococcus (in: high G+C Gram-positive bacteria) TaxID=192944 RepID=UPI00109DF25A|nr:MULTISPECIES: alpha/beta fold hydrolase [unclassified Rhodococcus (in: high G+C Gram-positive bacteria)]QCB51009.1 alpha/beta fold hydrolase [Rhodococcus sp. PAMC28705]QCB57298.1 alpha/beta fold hydrolase [Rhodococcus sp. PAMC28707]